MTTTLDDATLVTYTYLMTTTELTTYQENTKRIALALLEEEFEAGKISTAEFRKREAEIETMYE